jgi:hypothetical protein
MKAPEAVRDPGGLKWKCPTCGYLNLDQEGDCLACLNPDLCPYVFKKLPWEAPDLVEEG